MGHRCFERQDAARLNTPRWLWDAWSPRLRRKQCAWHRADAYARGPARHHGARRYGGLGRTARSDCPADRGRCGGTTGGAIASLPGYGEGGWWIQDAAAAMPARLLGDVAGKRVIDLCAAPGGKTAQLAARAPT